MHMIVKWGEASGLTFANASLLFTLIRGKLSVSEAQATSPYPEEISDLVELPGYPKTFKKGGPLTGKGGLLT